MLIFFFFFLPTSYFGLPCKRGVWDIFNLNERLKTTGCYSLNSEHDAFWFGFLGASTATKKLRNSPQLSFNFLLPKSSLVGLLAALNVFSVLVSLRLSIKLRLYDLKRNGAISMYML